MTVLNISGSQSISERSKAGLRRSGAGETEAVGATFDDCEKTSLQNPLGRDQRVLFRPNPLDESHQAVEYTEPNCSAGTSQNAPERSHEDVGTPISALLVPNVVSDLFWGQFRLLGAIATASIEVRIR